MPGKRKAIERKRREYRKERGNYRTGERKGKERKIM